MSEKNKGPFEFESKPAKAGQSLLSRLMSGMQPRHVIVVGVGLGAVFITGFEYADASFKKDLEKITNQTVSVMNAQNKAQLEDQLYEQRTGECVQSIMGLDAYDIANYDYNEANRHLRFTLVASDRQRTLAVNSETMPTRTSTNDRAFYDSVAVCADYAAMGDRGAARRDIRATGFKPEEFTLGG